MRFVKADHRRRAAVSPAVRQTRSSRSWRTLREEVKRLVVSQEEDVLTYALFEQVATKFFEARKAKLYGLDDKNGDPALGIHMA